MTEGENLPQRFLDADQEPQQILTPISGYEIYPLVSLKESIEPIKSLLYNCDAMIEIALRNSRNPADGLTQDESASIHLYTMQWPQPHSSLFILLNERLRSYDRNNLIPWFFFLKLFFTALYKLPSYRGTIWRGVKGNLSDQYNDDHFWWGLSSCTETISKHGKFMKNNSTRTVFNIECFSGKSIQSHSYFKEQNEILLLPGTYFQVVRKWKATDDLFIIHLREQLPPFQTIVSPLLQFESITLPNNITSNNLSGTKFKKHGITVAGGNGEDEKLNQLNEPYGIFVDEHKDIYIADYWNHRIVQWKYNDKQGQIIADGNRIDKLSRPTDVIVDQSDHSLIIADWGNQRIVRCLSQNQQEILIENIDCDSLAMDKYGFLYISDTKKNEVRRWEIGEKDKERILVAGGNGIGDKLNQLSFPTCIFVDEEQSVYVSDSFNHRVMKWTKDAREGIIVAGGNGCGNSLNQLSYPRGLFVDQWRQIYVADYLNDRIMRWCEGKNVGEIVVGGNGKGNGSNQFYRPYGLSFDLEGNLYVTDLYNHRIQKFEIIS